MTDIRKSDAQLDAEAGAIEDRDLDTAIALHRAMYGIETSLLKLHQRDGESGLGPPFSPAFAALLDGRYYFFPWRQALDYLRWACSQTHTKHRTSDLCYGLVSLVIRYELPISEAQRTLTLPDTGKTRRTLDSALLTMERRLEALAADQKPEVRREPVEWMAAPHSHQPLDGLHREDCSNPACRRVA